MSAPTTLHSNATNFASYVQSGVDQRTGLFTASFSLPEIKSNDLSGTIVPLHLNFSPLKTLDDGYGRGWSLPLTEYQPSTQIISVHSSESFKVTGDYADVGEPDRLKMKEQKIQRFKLFKLTGDPRGDFQVVHASGLVEILKLMGTTPQIAMPVKVYSEQGHEVTLTYQSAGQGRMLSTVTDSQGTLLQVVRNLTASTVEFRLKPIQGVPSAVFTLQLEGERMTRVTLPTPNNAGWRVLYEDVRTQLCISEIWDPLGGHQKVQYNDAGHGFPPQAGFPNLARVTDHVSTPGASQPPIVKKYSYSNNGNNFLGYNSVVGWDKGGEDNLYKITGEYLYETTESLVVAGAPPRTVTRTYNRFHLMTSEITVEGNCQKTILTTHYANDTDTFDRQDTRCQLPQRTTELWHLTDDPRSWRQDKKLTEYDFHGNLTKTVQANGITEEIAYYPAAGVTGECPPDPYGFVRHVREKTVIPATDPTLVPDVQSGAATLRSRYRYQAMPPIAGGMTRSWVALVDEQMLEVSQSTEKLMQRAVYTYFNNPANPLTHGRRQQHAVTVGTAPGYTTSTAFAYSKHLATYATFAGETVLRTVETLSTDFDSVNKSITQERSLLHGEPLLVTDKDQQVRYTYDSLLRVVKEEDAPNSPYPASRTFSYTLIRPADQGGAPVTTLAGQEMVDVKKVKIRTWFDGLSRAIKEERQDLDNAGGNPPLFRSTYEASYDAYGQLISEIEIDWLAKTNLRLGKTYTYDFWGQQDSATGANGITSHTRANPLNFTVEQWIPGVGKSVTTSNRFDKTVKSEQFDLSGKRISLHRYKYNGLGNCVEEIDALGRVTKFSYDAHARLITNTLPDRTVISRSYAAHSATPLVSELTVQPGNSLLPRKTVGSRIFDGLERVTEVTVGGRVEQLHYEDERLQPSHRVTPAGNQILYEYKPGLTTRPSAIKTKEDDATFDYDLLNANLETSSNARGTYDFTYTNVGHLSVESWKEPTNPTPWVTRYSSSLKGRQLTRTDVGGQVTVAEYHATNGRLIGLKQCQLQAGFEYDTCGRLFRTISTDVGSGNTLTTTLTFDDIGREKNRTVALLDAQDKPLHPVRSIELTYLADGNIETRHLQVGGVTALHETFHYDLRGRLELHKCSGIDLPKDRFGNAIVTQYYEFDSLDNVIYQRTDFDDGTRDIAQFDFAVADPCQLVKAVHSHADYQGLLTDYLYDPDGNQTRDEKGQLLRYDSQGRLMEVSTAAGQPVTGYDYDAHDLLVATQPQGEMQSLRFYEGTRLSDVMQNGKHTQLLNCGGQPLGQQEPGDDSQTLLLLADAKHSVIAESQADELRTAVYTAYGELSEDAQLESLVAFNGEVRDKVCGWYMLGQGYRAYNPHLMRFHSPDSLSPFGAGGINCYKFALGNPIAFSDPSGHAPGTSLVQQPGVIYGSMATTIFLGIVVSIVTLNPAPLAAAVKVLAVQAGASAVTSVLLSASVTAGAAAMNAIAPAVTWGSFAAGLGVQAASMGVKGEAQVNLSWVGFGLNWLMMPGLQAFKPKLPALSNSTTNLRKASTASNFSTVSTISNASDISNASGSSIASNSVYDLMYSAAIGPNVTFRERPFANIANYAPSVFRQARILEALEDVAIQNHSSITGRAIETGMTNPAHSTRSTISATAEPFKIDAIAPPRVQEWIGGMTRQAAHKPILSFAHFDTLV
ncbi:RHS repeat-associated core domain-containing protein [Pseudomonas sp. GB2N2]